MIQTIISEEEKCSFEVFKYSYPTGSTNTILAYKILKDILNKIDSLSNKEIFLKEELDFFEFMKKSIKTIEKFSKKPIVHFDKLDQIAINGRNIAIKAIEARLNFIENKIISWILKEGATPFFEKAIYTIQLFKKTLEINEYNLKFYSKSRTKTSYDRLNAICEADYRFGIILIDNNEVELNNLIYDFREIVTPDILYHYKKKLAII